jgi:hypothetical protein
MQDFDTIMRLTASAICGTDLRFVRGTLPGMQEGTILGRESPPPWERSFIPSAVGGRCTPACPDVKCCFALVS